MAIITEGEYKGRATLTIKRDENDKYPFTFGYAKARLLVENIEAIKKFVDKHKNDAKPASNESFT